MRALAPVLTLAAALAASAAPGVRQLDPLPPGQAVSTHGPFEMGACVACHLEKKGVPGPGPVAKKTNDLCFDCHDEFKQPVANHPKGKASCLSCHSPHNARKKKLLL